MANGLAAFRLLVADDNAQMRSIVGAVLYGAGVREIHYAENGERALEVVAHKQIDIVYVDQEMPVMNGLDFISAVRGPHGPDRFLPIIMLTGNSSRARLEAARDRGVTEFLTKPVTARTILNRLNAVIMHPRPFVQTKSYFGPDRRRKSDAAYAGPPRRLTDHRNVLEI
jgi:CheY-like chemotaxis protein